MTNKRAEANDPNSESEKKMTSIDLSEKGMKERRPGVPSLESLHFFSGQSRHLHNHGQSRDLSREDTLMRGFADLSKSCKLVACAKHITATLL